VKFLRLLTRIRYWKRRAHLSEQRCVDLIEQYAAEIKELQTKMDAEHWRNQAREDVFVSASVLGGRGMWGVAPRTGPATTQRPPNLLDMAAQGPIMTGADRMEFEQYWFPDAMRAGVSRQQAEKDFLEELAKRKALNDEPSM
jgi:hypothetical protein